MSEQGIYSSLSADPNVSAAVSSRIYPVIAPQNTLAPFIVYQRVVGVSENGLNESLGLVNCRFQVDAYATTYAETKLLAGYIKTAIRASSMTVKLLTDQDLGQETDTQLYRVSMDFSILVEE